MKRLNSSGNVVVPRIGPKIPKHYRIANRIVSEIVNKEMQRFRQE
jgi:hypothetical protein